MNHYSRIISLIVFALTTDVLFAQSLGTIVTVTNANYSCSAVNRLMLVTAQTSAVTITLSRASAMGQEVKVTVVDGTFNVTVVKNGLDVSIVDPTNSVYMGGSSCAAGESVSLISDGAGRWYVFDARNIGCSNWQAAPTSGGSAVPAGTAVGQLLYYTGTKWSTLAAGTSSQVLTSAGAAAPTWQTSSSSGIPTGGVIGFTSTTAQSGYSNTGLSTSFSGNTWATKTSSSSTHNAGVTATVNGKLYLIGGASCNCTGTPISVNEEYDPSTNAWTAKSTTGFTPRIGAAASVVNNKIYVVGGLNSSATTIGTVEEYDPSTNTWATKASCTGRSGHVTASVNGILFAIGGYTGSAYTNLIEAYDPTTNTWSTKSSTGATARSNMACAVVNNKIYVFGGDVPSKVSTNEEYNPSTNTWATKASMPTARGELAGASVNNKCYAITGSLSSGFTNANEEYDPSSDTWATKSSTGLTSRIYAQATDINGKIYLLGGWNGSAALSTNEEFTPGATLYYFSKN